MANSKRTGLAVDTSGGVAVDPTANVKDLTEAATQRQDDLREAERRYNDLRDSHQKEIAALLASHQKEMAAKESSRLDSIRQVDREDVAKTAATANTAIATLAKQTTDLATTLQTQVGQTASASETRRSADMTEVNKRVSALELASSASAGKQTVADPMMAEFVSEMKRLVAANQTSTGRSAGIDKATALVLAVIASLGAIGVSIVVKLAQ